MTSVDPSSCTWQTGTGGSAVSSILRQLTTLAEIEEVWGLPCGTSVASLVANRAEPKWEAIVEMAAHGDELEHACSARRRREGRLRAWWRHEQFAIRCAVASATHHRANCKEYTSKYRKLATKTLRQKL